MATDQEKIAEIKLITNLVEANSNILRNTAKNLSGLINLGRATCEEIKAYNVYAISTYYTQKSLLTQLRALGQTNVPEVPPTPTWFVWKDVPGNEAWRVDCGTPTKSMAGVLAAAVASTQGASPHYVSPDAIQIVMGDRAQLPPASAVPTGAQIMKAGDGGLAGFQTLGDFGLTAIVIILVGITVALSVAVVVAFWSKASSDNATSRATVASVNASAQKYDTYIATRMSCLDKCLANKGTLEECQDLCTAVVPKPPEDPMAKKPESGMSTLEKVGFATLASGALYVGYRLWLKHRENVAV